jgi:hypothetical protein
VYCGWLEAWFSGCNGASIGEDIVFSADVGGGERVVLFLYTNLHCTCENMLFRSP